ncbi:MAG: TrbC/VirB2 family protein [Deltaproteobacteria bacterium]|jgi:type IV secretory pathway VirB2 component (pilin)|nr:TrbC/VirB2 family protein [Deltaproteobacteria bacterium]
MKFNKRFACAALICGGLLLMPDLAGAAEVGALFSSPLQKILDLMTGTIAGLIVALAVVIAGIMYVYNKEGLEAWVTYLMRIAIGGVIIYGGGHIAKWWFG